MLSNTITIVPVGEPTAHVDVVMEPLKAFDAPTTTTTTPTTITTRGVSFPATTLNPLDTMAWTRKQAASEALVERISEIIASYRISGPEDHYETVYRPQLLSTLRYFVSRQEAINMVVPAYPFKSPNREEKVLGPDPDVGERMSLEHFNSIGARISQIYPPGGYVTIVSDGCCYNDLLGVSDEEVFRYAEGLHRIVDRLGLKHLRFSDPFDLIEGKHNVPVTEEEYASRIGELKDRLFTTYMPAGYDFDESLKHDPNATLTYRGYIRFLMSDLAMFFKEKQMSKSAIKKHCASVARRMIERGKVFSALVASASPLHVRLSIHASDNTSKLSVTLLPQERYSAFPVTPWHNTPYLDTESVSLSLSRKPAGPAVSYRLCTDNLGLAFLCADAPLYQVIDTSREKTPQLLQLTPLYPFGLQIKVPHDTPLSDFRLDNVAALARVHSPIIFEGLDPMQYTAAIADDFHRVAGSKLSLSILHEGIASTTATTTQQRRARSYLPDAAAVTSYFVAVPARNADDPLAFLEAATALDDVRSRVLHRWQAGHAVVADHRVALPVHLSPSSLRVLRG
ncbi:isocyanide synthase family protein [Aspergillus saccharolyticus JOP 1030-1]|uniref:Putative spore wall assembly protein Dit1 n=1 Tax=Aspergillus saccharolyticus JOP 1030-1 TaxID=1450539 RepID=A0A318Z715_9EURO|nr:putative spore wall assembly protein Dit1 [Aspergillus saccharolyticus JOP 1030-1]PYH43121.1 putative spore wall assembly protein Dit1 [Aspergillus saccharolyticus JOP 1030-1]